MFTLRHIEYHHLVKNFAEHLSRLGYSKGGVSMLPTCVREFLYRQEQEELYDLGQITSGDITDHHEYLQQRPNLRRPGGLSPRMISHHLYALKLFFNWLQELRLIEANPMSALHFERPENKTREILTREEITSLYEACQTLKEHAILHVFYGCGLRRNEGEKLNIRDVHFRQKVLYVREGKGGKSRAVPLTEKVSEELKAYCYQQRKARPQEHALITNNWGTRMQGNQYNSKLKELISRTSINKEISLHSLRHSIATHLLERGLSVEYVRDFLGHAHIDSTERYTHIKHLVSWI